jgi:hypothetical protein
MLIVINEKARNKACLTRRNLFISIRFSGIFSKFTSNTSKSQVFNHLFDYRRDCWDEEESERGMETKRYS